MPVAMWFFWYIGNHAFLGDAASRISAHGTSVANSIPFLGIDAIGYPAGAIVMVFVTDRFERRLLIFGSTLVWLAGMILVGSGANDEMPTLGSLAARTSALRQAEYPIAAMGRSHKSSGGSAPRARRMRMYDTSYATDALSSIKV